MSTLFREWRKKKKKKRTEIDGNKEKLKVEKCLNKLCIVLNESGLLKGNRRVKSGPLMWKNEQPGK